MKKVLLPRLNSFNFKNYLSFILIALLATNININSFGQSCPVATTGNAACDGNFVTIVNIDALPVCGTGSVDLSGNISNGRCLDQSPSPLNCHKFVFQRAPGSLTQQFTFKLGQGQGCTGELDKSYTLIGGTCSISSNGGSQSTVTFTFPLGIDEMVLYMCVNSSANVSICGLCKQPPPCNPAPACILPSNVSLTNQCSIPAAFTNMSSVFSNIGTCNQSLLEMTSTDNGDTNICGGATFTRTYNLYLKDPSGVKTLYKQCVQSFTISSPTLTVTCPTAVSLAACQTESAIVASYNAWKAGFVVSGGCNSSSNITSIPALPAYSCGAINLSFTLSATDNCNSTPKTCTSTFQVAAVGGSTPALSVNCPAPVMLGACLSESAIQNAYNTWKNGFTNSGGCTVSTNITSIPALPAYNCNNPINLSFEYIATDICTNDQKKCTSTFVVAAPSIPNSITIPNTTYDCNSNTTISAAYTNWLNSATFAGTCAISLSNNSSGPPPLCGGSKTVIFTLNGNCGNITKEATFTVNEPILPIMTPPNGITVSCGTSLIGSKLTFTNGLSGDCLITGQSNNSTFSSVNACGGTVTETWTATDVCGRTLASVSRNITVLPAPEATFATPTTIAPIACSAAPPVGTALTYTNGGSGDCLISGSATGVITGSHTECGGSYTETWTFTDDCQRTITTSRTITVLPAALPTMTAPDKINVECGALPQPTRISFTNNSPGDCLLSGTSDLSIIEGTFNGCGSTVTETWTATDNCGRALASVSRIITFIDTAPPTFTGPPNITLGTDENCDYNANVQITGSPTGLTDTCDPNPVINYTDEVINSATGTFCDQDRKTLNHGPGIKFPIVMSGYNGIGANKLQNINLSFTTNKGKGRAEFILIAPDGSAVVLVGEICNTGNCNSANSQKVGYAPTFYSEAAGAAFPVWNNTNAISSGVGNFRPFGGANYVDDGLSGVTLKSKIDDLTGDMNGTWYIFGYKSEIDNGDVKLESFCLVPPKTCSDLIIKRTWVATDACGNDSQPYIQTITVKDQIAPVITCDANVVYENPQATTCTYQKVLMPTVTDNCTATEDIKVTYTLSGATILNTPTAVSTNEVTFNKGITTVTYTATDLCGNTSTCTFLVTVRCESEIVCTFWSEDYAGESLNPTCSEFGVVDIQNAMLSALGGNPHIFGSATNGFELTPIDITSGDINDLLANGIVPLPGTSAVLAAGISNSASNNASITAGVIQNPLLIRTIALYFNLQNSIALDNIEITNNMWTQLVDCGTGVPFGPNILTQMPAPVVSYLFNGANGYPRTVKGLFDLANDVLGGTTVLGAPSTFMPTIDELKIAIERINGAFRNCAVIVAANINATGNLFFDLDGMTDGVIDGNPGAILNGTPSGQAGVQLYLTLIEGDALDANPGPTFGENTGAILKVAPVTSMGTYLFDPVVAGTYTINLGTNPAGNRKPALPSSLVFAGEGGRLTTLADAPLPVGYAIGDGNPNGKIVLVATTTTVTYVNGARAMAPMADLTDINFAITNAPLPVRLVSFSGKSTENGNLLNWESSAEQNFSHYELERSTNAASFKQIAKISGASLIKENLKYSYLDNGDTGLLSGANLPKNEIGNAYYRLKMVDFDGKYEYSKVIFIKAENEKSLVGEFYPNPSSGLETNIKITSSMNTNWTITSYDMAGRVVSQENKVLEIGNNLLKVNLDKLSIGVNIIRFENSDGIQYRKIMKK